VIYHGELKIVASIIDRSDGNADWTVPYVPMIIVCSFDNCLVYR
jgi:hypothetical protein